MKLIAIITRHLHLNYDKSPPKFWIPMLLPLNHILNKCIYLELYTTTIPIMKHTAARGRY